MVKSWFEAFSGEMNTVFTKEDFLKYNDMVRKDFLLFKKYVKLPGKILDVGCGLGCTAVPLSTYGYDVTGIDNDPKVVEAAQQNAENFGGRIKILFGDALDIARVFGKDSFNACISGGVLEHFSEGQIRELINKQLYVAPVVIASMPIAVDDARELYKDHERRICKDGFYRNLWTADHWLKHVLRGFNVLEHHAGKASEAIGGFDELLVIMGR